MTICSCYLWSQLNRLCVYYMAICYMAGMLYLAKVFQLGQWIAVHMAMTHLKITVGV